MRLWLALVLGSCLFPIMTVLAQQPKDGGSIPIVFHVTSVKQDEPPDWCTTGQCNAVRFTVEGYARVEHDAHPTQFVLKCIELTDADGHITMACARLRAHGNYNAKLWADLVQFIDRRPKQPNDPPQALFDIVSQEEVATPQK
jgi:hypothetical protein